MEKLKNWFEGLSVVKWIRVLQRIVRTYDDTTEQVHSKIACATRIAQTAEQVIRDRTDLNVGIDINMAAPNQVIVMGRYNNTDYVEVFSLIDNDFVEIIHHLNHLQKHSHVNRVDAPISMRAVIKQETDRFR